MSKDRARQKAEDDATSLHDRNQHTLRTEDEAQLPNPRIKRHASVYDAVAGGSQYPSSSIRCLLFQAESDTTASCRKFHMG